jgi:uncharacterized membrane protein YbhN (UPF0104 family)
VKRLVGGTLFTVMTALAVYLFYRGMAEFSVSLFLRQLRDVSLGRLSLFVLPFGLGLWVKWLRWVLCIRYVDPTVSGHTVWRAQLWGYCASNTLPFKAGEAVKLGVLKKKGHAVLPLLPTIALDRFWDGAVLLVLLLAALPFFAVAPWVGEMAVLAGVLFVGGLVVFCGVVLFLPIFAASLRKKKNHPKGFALWDPFAPAAEDGSGFPSPSVSSAREALRARRDRSKRFALWDPFAPAAEDGSGFPSPSVSSAREALRARRDRSKRFALWSPFQSIFRGLLALRAFRLWGVLAGLSVLNWAAEIACFAVVFWAFGLTVPIAASVIAVAAVNFAGLAMSVPASIGVFEFCMVMVLVSVGLSQGAAFGIALVLHALVVLPVFLVAGLVFAVDMFGRDRRGSV